MAGGGEEKDIKQRLLEAAANVFAEEGFRDATNRQIAERADANVAVVNYYFRSKENLYAEAWREAFRESLRRDPPDGGVPASVAPEKRLHGRVRGLVEQIADERNQAFLMIHKEMAAPTALLDEVKRECLTPPAEEVD